MSVRESRLERNDNVQKLMIIGASALQLPAIRKAKEMGMYVGVVDYNPQAIGIPYADEYFM
jgi:2-keto-3-deoxy-L-rhamnonate aldolase RhmA